MSRFALSFAAASAAAILTSISSPVSADVSPFAVDVIEYVPGAAPAEYQTASAALGKTNEFTPAWPEFGTPAYVVSPFNATYAEDDLVAIGDGGRLVLRLGQPAATNAGHAIGVHAGVGLIDGAWPSGTVIGPATPYTAFRSADVRVSANGTDWYSVGEDIIFENPTNWYAQGVSLPGAQVAAGTVEADFTRPFLGTLSDFDNTGWSEMLAILDGSAGGTWLDLSGLPIPAVSFIEFSVTGAGEVMFVDTVVAIPEPGLLALPAVGLLALRRRAAGRRA